MILTPVWKLLLTVAMVVILTSNFGIVNVNAQTGTVTVIKHVDNQLNAGEPVGPEEFLVGITFSPSGKFQEGRGGVTATAEIGDTDFRVTETGPSNVPSNQDFEGDCDPNGNGVVTTGGQTCTLVNRISSSPDNVEDIGDSLSLDTPPPQTVKQTEQESGLTVTPPKGIAPFGKCVAPVIEEADTNQADSDADPNQATKDETDVIRQPSSAAYTIDGTTSIRDLFKALQDDNEMTIKIFQDRQADDGVTLGVASPSFTGQLFIGEDPELFPSEYFRYDIDDISTACDYITLTDPISQNPQVRFTPLANTSEIKTSSLNFDGDPTTNHLPNELLAYCAQDSKVASECVANLRELGFSTSVINPPFASCQNTVQNSQGAPRNPDESQAWAQYIIKGNIGMIPTQSFVDLVSGDSTGQLMVKLVADLVLLNTDEIKIADSNNPFLTVYLVINPNEPTSTRVPVTIQQVFTQCSAADFIYDPQIS